MPILHFGVHDVPYAQRARGKKRGKKVASGTQTTGNVAGWLEDKYGIKEAFFIAKGPQIAAALEGSLAGMFENMLMGAPTGGDPFAAGTSKIDAMFKDFISNREIEKIGIAGVPTQAALKGINHRLKSKRGVRRPSFLDTGLYVSSSVSWVTEK